jgi:hypothetical protein
MLQARNVFPGLIADLVRAEAPNISNIRFPSGDKGQVRGFDGHLDANVDSPYVPNGKSIWEFGVNAAGAAKADGDYTKRTGEVPENVRMETTFVFVSPRTWDNPQLKLSDWVEKKKELNEWMDVIYIDGSMVEDWLDRCPAVAARYAKHELKKMPVIGVRSTDEYWDEFSTRFAPSLVEQVLLAGREEQAKNLIHRLNEGPSLLLYAGDSPEEILAFAVAAIRLAEPSVRLFLEAKTLILDTEEAARQLAVRDGLVFLPGAPARHLGGLLSRSGPTVVGAGADDKRARHEVLKRPQSSELGKALTGMGYSESEGYDLARKCGRSLAVLARRIPSGTATKPEWIDNDNDLLPALLAGAWSSIKQADQDVLCMLGQTEKYEQVEAPLRKLAKLQDPPVDHIDDVWTMRASVDAFVHLGHLIGPEHLNQFTAAATAVFSKSLEPPKAEEVFRPAASKAENHSDWLRNGMMNTLLHMAVLHEQAEFSVPGTTPQDFVNNIVRELPGLSSDHRLLASLEEQLSILAEAAPIPFLEALERLLEGDASGIKPIFDEHPGFISSHSYHCGVLWGLEVVAWDPKLLYRAAMCLARLAVVDPGGRVSNRPINSLRAIFLAWAPNTSAKAQQRKGVLTRIVREVPEIAWELIEKLLPNWSDVGDSSQKPAFREYDEEPEEVLTYGLIWDSQATVVDLALSLAGTDSERWSLLIQRQSNFPRQSFDSTLRALDVVLGTTEGDARFKIWDSLRKEVNRHITYASADWAFTPDVRSNLETLLAKYEPKNCIELSTWLFDDWMPDVPERKEEGKDITEAISEARGKALRGIFDSLGLSGVLELANKVKLPQHVGFTIRALELPFDDLLKIFQQSLMHTPSLDTIAGIVLFDGTSRFGDDWLTNARGTLQDVVQESERIAHVLMSLDESRKSWEYVATFGQEINDTYWRKKPSFYIQGDVEDLMLAIDNYLVIGRPMAALDASSSRLPDLPSELLLRLLDEAIEEINAAGPSVGTMHEYNIERAFDELRTRSDIAPDAVAKREFAYLPFFRHRNKTLVLHRLMAEQPQLFMDAISMVFRPKGVDLPPPTEAEQRRAMAAYELLESLHVLPGQSETEVDDEILITWCIEVRRLASNLDLEKVTENRIGQLLAHAPISAKDQAWPHESVRFAIENLASDEIERGIAIERFNMRGVFSKAIGEGGEQERKLAEQSKAWADAMPGFPRASAMLMRIAENWLRQAEHADISAEKETLRW